MKAWTVAVVLALWHLPLAADGGFVTVGLRPLGARAAARAAPIRGTRPEDLPDARRRLVESFVSDESGARVPAPGRGGVVPGVSSLGTRQVIYDDPEFGEPNPAEKNGILVSWLEDGDQTSIRLQVDGFDPIAVAPRSSPGAQLVTLTGLERCDPTANPGCPTASFAECRNDVERENLFRVSVTASDGTSDAVCQEIFRSWPLANFATFCARPAHSGATECEAAIFTTAAEAGLDCTRTADASEAICGIVVSGGNNGPSASQIAVILDGDIANPAVVHESGPAIKCFESLVEVEAERDIEVTFVGFLNRDKALATNWNDPVSGNTFSNLDGSFIGINPSVFLGRESIPELTFSVRSSCTSQPQFRRGDANADGGTDLSDGVFVLLFLFAGGEDARCADAMDVDDSGEIDISDAIGLFNFLFLGNADLPPPVGELCGPDPTDDDELGCEVSFTSAGLCN